MHMHMTCVICCVIICIIILLLHTALDSSNSIPSWQLNIPAVYALPLISMVSDPIEIFVYKEDTMSFIYTDKIVWKCCCPFVNMSDVSLKFWLNRHLTFNASSWKDIDMLSSSQYTSGWHCKEPNTSEICTNSSSCRSFISSDVTLTKLLSAMYSNVVIALTPCARNVPARHYRNRMKLLY